MLSPPAIAKEKPTLILNSTLNSKTSKLKFSAGRLFFRPNRACRKPCAAKLELVGKVTARAGDFVLKADRVLVWLEPKTRRALRIEASGKIYLSHGVRHGSAKKLSLNLKTGEIELLENASLRCPDLGLNLEGERITVGLESGKVTVHRARAQLNLRRFR